VDDEEEVREVLCALVSTLGYEAAGASGGQEALEALSRSSFDLVLTDLMMPDTNGWQLLQAIKQKNPKLPVVIVTGFLAEQGEMILTNPLVDGYLAKPLDHKRLEAMLAALLFPRNLGRAAEVVAVDDEKDTLDAIEAALTRRGLFVKTFQVPEDAEQQIRRHTPDLVIVDIRFPGGESGFDICKAIRRDADTAATPILVLTAHPSRENVEQAVALRVNGFIAKPFDANELAERALGTIRQAGLRQR
jgi:DNA-binding response OmpR family regulator